MIFYDGGKRQREGHTRTKIFQPSRAEPPQIILRRNKTKKQKIYHSPQKKARRERAKATPTKKNKKNKKKQKSCLMHKNLFSSSSKNSLSLLSLRGPYRN